MLAVREWDCAIDNLKAVNDQSGTVLIVKLKGVDGQSGTVLSSS